MADNRCPTGNPERPIYCAEFLNPERSGCKAIDLEERMTTVEHAMNGSPDHPEAGIRYQLFEIKAYGRATTFWAKLVAWVIITFILSMTAYIASLELRGKTGMLIHHTTTGQVYCAHLRSRSQLYTC